MKNKKTAASRLRSIVNIIVAVLLFGKRALSPRRHFIVKHWQMVVRTEFITVSLFISRRGKDQVLKGLSNVYIMQKKSRVI